MSDTIEKQLEAARLKMEAELEKKRREFTIRAALPPLEGLSVRPCDVGGITFISVEKDSAYDARPVTLADVEAIAEACPPVPSVHLEGTFTTFARADAPETKKDRYNSETEIAPVRVDIDPNDHAQSIELRWFTDCAGCPCEVRVKLPLYAFGRNLGRVNLRWVKYIGGKRCGKCTFTPDHSKIGVIEDQDGQGIATLAPVIRWSAGSQEYANHFTLFWYPEVNRRPMLPVDLARVLFA